MFWTCSKEQSSVSDRLSQPSLQVEAVQSLGIIELTLLLAVRG